MLKRDQAFEQLRKNLELTELQEQKVAERQQNVREAVAAQLTAVDDFLSGSYRRHTLIGPLKGADVDVIVVLDRSYRDLGARAVLDRVRKALLAKYPPHEDQPQRTSGNDRVRRLCRRRCSSLSSSVVGLDRRLGHLRLGQR